MTAAIHEITAINHHRFTLQRLTDPNWTGLDLYYRLKPFVRRGELLQKIEKRGLLEIIASSTFDEYIFELDVDNERAPHINSGEHRLFYLEDLVELISFHSYDNSNNRLARTRAYLTQMSELFESDEDRYLSSLETVHTKSMMHLRCERLRQDFKNVLLEIRPQYVAAQASRMFHDRQACRFVVGVTRQIGVYGDTEQPNNCGSWMPRKRIPKWARDRVTLRDGDKCASCGLDFTTQPKQPNLRRMDHVIPLGAGGCNDIANLQLLCHHCNTEKGMDLKPTKTSVPEYFRVQRGPKNKSV